VRARAGAVHGYPLRTGSGVQASAGHGMLPDAVLLRSPQVLRSILLQLK